MRERNAEAKKYYSLWQKKDSEGKSDFYDSFKSLTGIQATRSELKESIQQVNYFLSVFQSVSLCLYFEIWLASSNFVAHRPCTAIDAHSLFMFTIWRRTNLTAWRRSQYGCPCPETGYSLPRAAPQCVPHLPD